MTTVNDQVEMFYKATRDASEANQAFLWLVENGLTKRDLQRNIERRPSLWGRFESWLGNLPD